MSRLASAGTWEGCRIDYEDEDEDCSPNSLPSPKGDEEDVARRVVALMERFDEETMAVYRVYCLKGQSVTEVTGSPPVRW